jgi:hypothetical protein
MAKFFWRNGFAVGVTLGALSTVLVLVGHTFVRDLYHCLQGEDCSVHVTKYRDNAVPDLWWWDWDGKLVSSGDTVAQWIMTIFSIAAVILLWRTLVETNRATRAATVAATAATDANAIMRDEQRPFLIPRSCRVEPQPGGMQHVFFEWENVGKGPGCVVSFGRVKSSDWGSQSLQELRQHVAQHFASLETNAVVPVDGTHTHQMCWFSYSDISAVYHDHGTHRAIRPFYIFFKIKYNSPLSVARVFETETVLEVKTVVQSGGGHAILGGGPAPNRDKIIGFTTEILHAETKYT